MAANEKDIRKKLALLEIDTIPTYKDLRWRFDV
jgi:hypothetical protein